MWRSTAHFPAQGLRKRASLSNCLTLACRLGFREYGCLRMGLKCRICKELLLCFWIQTCENMTQRFMACPEVNVRAWTRAPEIDACSHFAPQRCVFTPHRAAASDSPNGNLSQEQARMEIMQGDKWRETNEGRSSQEHQNGDHAGRQMKGD